MRPSDRAQESAEAIVGGLFTEGPNGMEWQVGRISHDGQAAEKPDEAGLSGRG